MHVWVNSIIEGELEPSPSAPEELATSGLGNLLRLHRLAGREVSRLETDGEPAYQVLHDDGTVHAVHWLSLRDEGAHAPFRQGQRSQFSSTP